VFKHERRDWALGVDEGVETRNVLFSPLAGKGVSVASFPSGLASARVELTLADGSRADVDLVAGFFGVEQKRADASLAPVIGWCVAELPPENPIVLE